MNILPNEITENRLWTEGGGVWDRVIEPLDR